MGVIGLLPLCESLRWARKSFPHPGHPSLSVHLKSWSYLIYYWDSNRDNKYVSPSINSSAAFHGFCFENERLHFNNLLPEYLPRNPGHANSTRPCVDQQPHARALVAWIAHPGSFRDWDTRNAIGPVWHYREGSSVLKQHSGLCGEQYFCQVAQPSLETDRFCFKSLWLHFRRGDAILRTN